MSAVHAPRDNRSVIELLTDLRRRRVRLWSENGQLRYRAPKGAVSSDDLEQLSRMGAKIVALLESAPQSQAVLPPLVPRHLADHVPLSYSQLKYWHAYQLNERPTLRSVAFATAVSGPLDVKLLRRCAEKVVERHESLRTRIVMIDGAPAQLVDEAGKLEFPVFDLTDRPEQLRPEEVQRLIHALICTPVHVSVGPLFGLQLMKVAHEEHVLVIAMEHIISDGFSLNLFLRDLLSLYLQASGIGDAPLPAISIQLPDYAVWQRKAHEAWMEVHGKYWQQRLAGCRRMIFPQDVTSPAPDTAGYGTVPVRIRAEVKHALTQWCRARRTTVVLTLFTLFSALILKWCRQSDAVVRYQADGRVTPLIENSIGYFAAVMNLRIEMRDDDTLLDLLARITREYCAAFEHADVSFIDSQVPRPAFTRNPGFNWVPCSPTALPGGSKAQEPLRLRPWPFERPRVEGYEWEDEPSIMLLEHPERIDGTLFFAPKQVSFAAMEGFRDDFMNAIDLLLTRPESKVADLRARRSSGGDGAARRTQPRP